MTTVNNRNVSLSPRKFGASRFIRNVSSPSGKSEDAKQKGFLNRPRKGGKSIWEWMDFLVKLAIPLVVALATVGFGWWQTQLAQQQHEADQQSALDQQRQATLVTYLDNMNNLLLNRGLLNSKPNDEIRVIARTETLSAIRQLDGVRNRFLVQFLQDAHLIGYHSGNIVNFENADLSSTYVSFANLSGPDIHIDLSFANLSGADLHEAKLINDTLYSVNLSGAILTGAILGLADLTAAHLDGANLDGANLGNAVLSNAKLTHANLSNAYLGDADFTDARLSNAYLSDADLFGAILYNADLSGDHLDGAHLVGTDITQKQLDQVYSCKNAILPPGLTCHENH